MAVDPVSLAVTAALTAANMAMNAMQKYEGPRIKDAKGTVADYGTPLNYFRGTRLLTCPCPFSKPIVEKKKKRKGKSGKQVNYTGFGSWMSHIADHEIGGVLQVWFDNHLVYDKTGSGEKIYPLAEDYELEASMRIYLGTEVQTPDPDMLAYTEARDGLADVTPAYRGTSYIYFENVPLEQLGNRYPDVKVMAYIGDPLVPSSIRWRLYFPDGCVAEADGSRRVGINEIELFETTESTTDMTGDGSGAYGTATASSFTSPNVPARAFDDDFGSGGNWVTQSGQDVGSWIEWAFNGVETVRSFRIRSHHAFGEAWAPASVSLQYNTGSEWVTAAHFDGPLGFTGNEQWIRFDTEIGTVTSEPATFPTTTLEDVLTLVAQKAGLDADEYDFSDATQEIVGYNWTQGTGQQICEGLADILDCDMRPHDFKLEALARGSASEGSLPNTEFVRREGPPYTTPRKSDNDLPRRAFLIYADTTIDQNPNVAMPVGPDPDAAGTQRELSVDMQTLAIDPDYAQQLAERKLRRLRFSRNEAEFSLTRQRLEIEPGDVWTPSFDGDAMTMCVRKVIIGANGKIETEWERDDQAVAVLSGSEGAVAAGDIPDEIPEGVATEGLVMDLPYLVDAHDQSAPLAYLVAGPVEPAVWTGATFSVSDTGDLDSYTLDWDAIAAEDGSVIGECSTALDDNDLPWVFDGGSSVSVTINAGELTAATLDELLLDETRNLAAIESVGGWELVQFTTATLIGELTYTLSGFLRGVRGTEWAMGGHDVYDRFVLLENAKRHTLGASEIGDTDYYIASTTGLEVDQDTAFPLAFTGASHKPYAPVFGTMELNGADWEIDAVRRTRIGGNTLDGQDVPLGEASESWSLDIMDGVAVKRTITGTSLPLTYTEAQQITDWGGPLGAEPEANLYQVNPTLSLRGYPLYFPEGVS